MDAPSQPPDENNLPPEVIKYYWNIFKEQYWPHWEEVWERPMLGYVFLAAAGALIVYWHLSVPPPNYAVVAMGVAAALAALRPAMRGREKWLWTVAMFAFAWIEIRAVNVDRKKSEDNFSQISEGLKTSIKQSKDDFDATMRAANILNEK